MWGAPSPWVGSEGVGAPSPWSEAQGKSWLHRARSCGKGRLDPAGFGLCGGIEMSGDLYYKSFSSCDRNVIFMQSGFPSNLP